MAHLFVDIRGTERHRGDADYREPTRQRLPGLSLPSGRPLSGQPNWAVAALEGSAFALWGSAGESLRPRRVAPEPALGADEGTRREATPALERDLAGSPLVMRSADADGAEHWIAVDVPGSRLRINGVPLVTGARVLRHRDELRLAGVPGRAWFSLECRCEVAPFDGPSGSICPRCKQEIGLGSLSVRCPQCRIYYHESAEFPCWTYAPKCAFDDQSTDLDAGFRWTPAELEHDV